MLELSADPYDPAIVEAPWAFDAKLRAETPVWYDATNDIFLVSSYELVQRVIRDPATYSSRYLEKMMAKTPFPPEVLEIYAQGLPLVEALLVTDGTQHDRHRKIITTAFSRRRLNDLAPAFDERIAILFGRVRETGRMAFRRDFANAVPTVMTQQQLRIADADLSSVITWSEILSSGFGGAPKPIEQLQHEAREILRFQAYFRARLETELDGIARTGAGFGEEDLLSMLAAAITDPADPMDMVEALSFLFNLLPATHDTTTASLTACMHRFTASPAAQAKAVVEPDFLPKFVDEAMRHESPARGFWRRATVDTELAGIAIPAGSWLMLRVSAANRDETVFADADTFEPGRRTPKPSLSFGTGIHTCAGRIYARHIIVAALKHMIASARNFRFVPGGNDFRHENNVLVSPYHELEIVFDPIERSN